MISLPEEPPWRHMWSRVLASVSTMEYCGFNFVQIVALVTFVTFSSLGVILVTASRVNGELQYNAATAVLMSELLKLLVSTLVWSRSDEGWRYWSPRVFLLNAVPAASYSLQNTLNILAVSYLDPVTFQIFGGLKIIFTAVFARIILQRSLTSVQWAANVLLFLSMVLAKLNLLSGQATQTGNSSLGILLVIVTATMSGFAGIFSELLLKNVTKNASLPFKNMQLYTWGVAFLVPSVLFSSKGTLTFEGFNAYVWTWIFLFAAQGLSVSLILKHLSAIVKNFSSVAVVFVNLVCSVFFFGMQIDAPLLLGIILYAISCFLYFGPHNDALRISVSSHGFEPTATRAESIAPESEEVPMMNKSQ